MPDRYCSVALRHLEAVERLDEQLRLNLPEVRRMSRNEIVCYQNRGFVAGWRFLWLGRMSKKMEFCVFCLSLRPILPMIHFR
jgi:hypothetical protein